MIRWIGWVKQAVKWVWYEVKVRVWLWHYPSPISMVEQGMDRESRRIIYDRYNRTAPKP